MDDERWLSHRQLVERYFMRKRLASSILYLSGSFLRFMHRIESSNRQGAVFLLARRHVKTNEYVGLQYVQQNLRAMFSNIPPGSFAIPEDLKQETYAH